MGAHTPGLVFSQLWPSMWQVCNVLMPCWAGGRDGIIPLGDTAGGGLIAGRKANSCKLFMYDKFLDKCEFTQLPVSQACCGSADSSVCPSPSTEVMGCNYVISQERKEKNPRAW